MNTAFTGEVARQQEHRPAHQAHIQPRMNFPILLVVVLLVCFGLLVLFSASMTEGYASEGEATYYVAKQALITVAGLAAMLLLANMNIRLFDRPILFIPVYLVITLLLVLLHLPLPGITATINGATRWLKLPGIPQFQPSELAKIGLVYCFAGYTSWIRRRKDKNKAQRRSKSRSSSPVSTFFREGFIQFIIPGVAILIWIALIVTQPHLSCAIIMAGLAVCCFFAAGFSRKVWAAGLMIMVVVLILVVLLVSFILLPLMPDDYLDQYSYWARRINVFTDSDDASKDDRYQSDQSKIAIGSGGLTGVGLGQGRQKFNYLPEEFNDYVFAILAEELGLMGSLLVIALFMLLLLLGTAAALRTSGPFSTVIVFGYTSLVALQAFLNIGVAAGVLPPTGISLPLFSWGGTANFFFLLGIGLLLSASRVGGQSVRKRRVSHA